MKLSIHLETNEPMTNIGLAKALIESTLSPADLQELARYLLVFSDAHPTEKGGE